MPLSEKLVLGIDVGTSGLKAIALSESGAVVGRAERGYPLSTPRTGWAEQDPSRGFVKDRKRSVHPLYILCGAHGPICVRRGR